MSNIQEKIFNETMQKLGMNQSDHLTSKSIEILELIKAKNSEILKLMNENAKTIICLDISCELLNIPFAETNVAVQLSSLKKTQYNKNKKIVQKVLDLNRKMTIDEVIRKLNIVNSNAVEKMAKAIFKVYIKQHVYGDQEIDVSVFVMCVYFACKLENVKVPKKNILNLSNLTQRQFNVLEKSWEKWALTLKETSKEAKVEKTVVGKENIPESEHEMEDHSKTKKTEVTEETYDEWAMRILDKAYALLATNT